MQHARARARPRPACSPPTMHAPPPPPRRSPSATRTSTGTRRSCSWPPRACTPGRWGCRLPLHARMQQPAQASNHARLASTPQFVYCGKKATLVVGNVKPLGSMPEGTIICNVEEVRRRRGRACSNAGRQATQQQATHPPLHAPPPCAPQKAGDRGALARASGDYAIIVSHNVEQGITRIKLPSGSKKVQPARRHARTLARTPAHTHACGSARPVDVPAASSSEQTEPAARTRAHAARLLRRSEAATVAPEGGGFLQSRQLNHEPALPEPAPPPRCGGILQCLAPLCVCLCCACLWAAKPWPAHHALPSRHPAAPHAPTPPRRPLPAADREQPLPRRGGPSGWRRAHGEAHAEGRPRVPQVQGQAQQLAQGA